MDAKRCDRCLCFFDPAEDNEENETVHFKNPVYQTPKDYSQERVTHYHIPGRPCSCVELCPRCTKDFIEFMDFPSRRPGYIQEYEEEIEDLRDMIDRDEKERISTRQFIEKLVARVFGVSDISTYLNRKRDKDDNGDPKGGSNKQQGG